VSPSAVVDACIDDRASAEALSDIAWPFTLGICPIRWRFLLQCLAGSIVIATGVVAVSSR